MPEFIEENLRVIIFAVIVIIAVLQKVLEAAKAKKDNGGPTMEEIFGPDESPASTPPRRAPYTPPPLIKTTVPPLPRQGGTPPPLREAVSMSAPSAYDTEAELARQQEMEERIRKIRGARTSVSAATPAPAPVATITAVRTDPVHQGVIHRRLRHPRELRRAFIFKEILDRPLGLR